MATGDFYCYSTMTTTNDVYANTVTINAGSQYPMFLPNYAQAQANAAQQMWAGSLYGEGLYGPLVPRELTPCEWLDAEIDRVRVELS